MMKKTEVKFSCGHKAMVELPPEPIKARERIAYFRKHGHCPDCYRKQAELSRKAQGLILNAEATRDTDGKGEVLLQLWFTGDTVNHLDIIKSLKGYFYRPLYNSEHKGDVKAWQRRIPISRYETECARSLRAGVDTAIRNQGVWEENAIEDAIHRYERKDALEEAVEAVKRPAKPSILGAGYWNGKFYGPLDDRYIFVNGQKRHVSGDEVCNLVQYNKAKMQYNEETGRARREFLKKNTPILNSAT